MATLNFLTRFWIRLSFPIFLLCVCANLLPYGLLAQTLPGPGNSLSFDSFTQSFVTCGTSQRGILQQVTVEAWIKTTSPVYQWIAGKYSDQFGDERGFHLVTIGGRASINGRVGVGYYVTSGPSATQLNDGRWHHVAGVCANNVWRLYVDGVLENSGSYSYSSADLRTSAPLTIGNYYLHQDQFFDGEIDEVRVWNIARTEAQIRESMCHKFAVAPSGLVAYYRFDAAAGTAVVDAGSQPVPSSLQNFPAQPWHPSGAALGDRSSFSYASTSSPADISLLTLAGDTLRGAAFSAQARGAHLYVVDSAPSVPVPGGSSNAYFGIYAVQPAATYTAELRPQNCRALFQRADNSSPTWVPAVPTTRPGAVAATGIYRAEYAWAATGGAAPLPTILGNTTLCPGQATTLTAVSPGATFRWNTGDTTASINVTQPGSYSVQAVYANGCSSQATFAVTQVLPLVPFSLGPDTALCNAASLTLTAPIQPAGTRYQWSNGSSGPTLLVQRPGSYSLTVWTPCDTLTSTINVAPAISPLSFSLGRDTTLFDAATLLLTAPQQPVGVRYQWSDGSSDRELRVQQAGLYSLTAWSSCDTITATVRVRAAVSPPPFSLGADTTLCGSTSLLLTAPPQPVGTRYQWSDGSSGSSLTVRQPGTYSLTVRNTCNATTASIRVGAIDDSTTVPNIITPNADGYNDTFVVTQRCAAGPWALDVYSRWGRRVFSSAVYINDWTAPELPAGVYYYYLRQSMTGRALKGWVEVVR